MSVENVRSLVGTTIRRRVLLGGAVAGAVAAGAGCSFQNTGAEEGKSRLRMSLGNIETMDPHIVGSTINFATSGVMEGLVLQNADSTDVVPGAAESWDASEDLLTYTFHLRKDAVWSNDDPITADDVIWSFKRLMTPTGATANGATGSSSFQAGLGIKGAAEFATGALTDWEEVGVKALDDLTVEITLAERNPDFLISMTHYSMVLLHPASVEAMPTEWMLPENFVGSAAVVPDTWVRNSSMLLRKNPSYWDADNVFLDEVELRLGGDATSNLVAFKSGDLDFVRASGSVVKNDESITPKLAQAEGYSVIYLQAMWGGHPAVRDVRVRKALSLAIDRDALADIDGFAKGGTSLLPGTVPGWSDELATPYDPEAARKLLAEADTDVKKARVMNFFESPMLAVLKEQWRENLGIDLKLDIVESGVWVDTRLKPYEDSSTMSFYYGSYGGLPTMNTWVFIKFDPNRTRQMSLSLEDWEAYQKVQKDKGLDGGEKAAKLEEILATKSSPEAREFASLAAEARATVDKDQRTAKYVEAALVREHIYQSVPLIWGSMLAAVDDRVTGLDLRPSPESFYYKGIKVSD